MNINLSIIKKLLDFIFISNIIIFMIYLHITNIFKHHYGKQSSRPKYITTIIILITYRQSHSFLYSLFTTSLIYIQIIKKYTSKSKFIILCKYQIIFTKITL
jgi:hypothetical protein